MKIFVLMGCGYYTRNEGTCSVLLEPSMEIWLSNNI